VEAEDDLLAVWCAALPELRTQARNNGVLDRLDRDIARVRAGAAVRQLVLKWMPTDSDGTYRSWSDRPFFGLVGLPGMNRDLPVGAGTYGCPRDRCGRNASRDEHGHLPWCAAFDEPMRPA
jgi:hypothetical protein